MSYHTHRSSLEKARAAAVKKEEEDHLVRQLLGGQLSTLNDTDAQRVIKEVTKESAAPDSVAPASPMAMSRVLGRAAVERKQSVALQEAVELERARRKALDRVAAAMEGKGRGMRGARSQADKDKDDEDYYFQYEKLQELRTELDVARREISHEKYGANAQQVTQLLQASNGAADDRQLGDWETFQNVEKMMKGLLIRRHTVESEVDDMDSPAFLAMLKHKLNDAREHKNDLQKKVRELTQALKHATAESKSALALLQERNEDVERNRTTIVTLQQQLNNFRARASEKSAAGSAAAAVDSRSKEDLLVDYHQLQQQNQDLAQVNVTLEKQIKMLRIRQGMMGVGAGAGDRERKLELPTNMRKGAPRDDNTPRGPLGNRSTQQSAFGEDEIPTTKVLMHMLNAKRHWQTKMEKIEQSVMAAHDIDMGAPHRVDPIAAREHMRKMNMNLGGGGGIASGAQAEMARHASGMQRQRSRSRVESEPPTMDASSTTPQQSAIDRPAASPNAKALESPSPQASPQMSPRHADLSPSRSDRVTAASRAWVLLRQKLINHVALSRADVLRREEAHVKKLRKHIALLTGELSQAAADRDNLQDRLQKMDSEVTQAKEEAQLAQIRADRLQTQHQAYVESLPGTANSGHRVAVASRGNDEQNIASLRNEIAQSKGTDEAGGPNVDAQVENLISIFQSQIAGLKQDLAERDQRIMRLAQESEEATAAAAAAKTPRSGTIGDAADEGEDVTMRRLEQEVLRKDRELLEQGKAMKAQDLRRMAAEDALVEARAVKELGLSERAAARIVPKVRDWVHDIRKKRSDSNPGSPQDESMQPRSRNRYALGLDESLATAALLRVQMEEQLEEERSLLNQMCGMSTNPTILDHLSEQLSKLELDEFNAFEDSVAPVGDALSRNDRQWSHMRRLWLRLLTVREQSWQRCAEPSQRKRLEEKVIDTYAAFLKFEQLDHAQSRPSFACEGAMRSVTFATAPLTHETIRQEEVVREYTALKELVKSRAAQQLELESTRDELFAQLERLKSTTKKTQLAPQSALYILHTVRAGETAAAVATQYGLTNMALVRQSLMSAPRAVDAPDDGSARSMYVPLLSITALNAATETESVTLVVRHLVQPHDTINAIAAQYGVQSTGVCRAGTLDPLQPGDFVSVCDVLVTRRSAESFVRAVQPENPLVQAPVLLLGVLPKQMPALVASRTFNVGVTDMQVFNDLLEPGVTLRVPLVFSKALVSLLPDLLAEKRVAVMHEMGESETLESVADKYGVDVSDLQTKADVAGADATMVQLSDFDDLEQFVFDDATNATIQQVARSNSRQGKRDAYTLDTPLTKLMSREMDGSVQPEEMDEGTLKRVGSIRAKGSATESPTTATAPGTLAMSESTVQRFAQSPLEVRLIEHRVLAKERLDAVARKYKILREDIVVPNFHLLDSVMGQWLVRLRTSTSLEKAREVGVSVHCVINLIDESLVSLADTLGTTPETIRNANAELDLTNNVSEAVSGRVRVPVANMKTQTLAVKRTGEFYATTSAIGTSIENVCRELGVVASDVGAYDVQLVPAITPIVKIDCTAAVASEHMLSMSFPVMGLDFEKLSNDQLSKLRSRIERDLMQFASLTVTAQTKGTVESVSVTWLEGKDTAHVTFTCTSMQLLIAMETFINEDGPMENLEGTVEYINGELLALSDTPPLDKLGIVAYETQRHHFRTRWQDCHVASVQEKDTLADVALRLRVGVDALLAFNPGLVSRMFVVDNVNDVTAESLEGLTHLRIPGGRDQRMMVRKGDTLRRIADRAQCDVVALKRANIEHLPLNVVARSLRIPVHPVDLRNDSVITIRTHGAESESLLALATRHGVSLDDIRADTFTLSLGTVLRIPPTVGAALRTGHFRVMHPGREHRCDSDESLDAIALQYGMLTDEIKYQNAARLRIPPRTYVGLVTAPKADNLDTATKTFVRHVVQEGETVEMIASRYFQPITSILGMNPHLHDKPDVHRIFVPISSNETDDVLTSQASNIFTIITPGPYDTVATVSRKFMLNQDRVSDINQLLNDKHRMLLPITSPMAGTIARQKRLPLFVGIELARGETLVAVADRYGVTVKELIVLGRPLLPMGVEVVDVPISHDVATQLMKAAEVNPETAKMSPIYYRTTPLTTESVQSVTKDFALPGSVDATLVAGSSQIEVPLLSAAALDTARKREATLSKQRNTLAQRALEVNQALRQLVERNEATKRELAKVEALRASHGGMAGGGMFNQDSRGCQTDDALLQSMMVPFTLDGAGDVDVAVDSASSAERKTPTPPDALTPEPPAKEPTPQPSRNATPPAKSPSTKTLTAGGMAQGKSPRGAPLQPPQGALSNRAARRNGATQTKLLAEQLAQLEDTASSSSTKIRFMELKLDETQRDKKIAETKSEEAHRELNVLQAKLATLDEELKEREATIKRLETKRRMQRDASANMADIASIASATASRRAAESAKAETKAPTPEKEEPAASTDTLHVDTGVRNTVESASAATSMTPHAAAAGAVTQPPPPVDQSTVPTSMTPVSVQDTGCQTSDADNMLAALATTPRRPVVVTPALTDPSATVSPSPGLKPITPKHVPLEPREDAAGEREALVQQYETYVSEMQARDAQLLRTSMRGVREQVSDMRSDVRRIFDGLLGDIAANARELSARVSLEMATARKKEDAETTVASKIFTAGSAAVAKPTRPTQPAPAPVMSPKRPGPKPAGAPAIPDPKPVHDPAPVTEMLVAAATDDRPDASLEDRDWVTKHLGEMVVGEIAAAAHVPTPPQEEEPDVPERTPPPSDLPVIRTASVIKRTDSTVAPPPMRENVVQKVMSTGDSEQSSRASTTSEASRSYSEKPSAIADLMRLSDKRQHDERKARTPRLAPLPAPPSVPATNRLPTPPEEARSAQPTPRPQSVPKPERQPTPPAAKEEPSPRLHPRTPGEVANLQDDIAKLVAYAADQNDRMLEWQQERRSSRASSTAPSSSLPPIASTTPREADASVAPTPRAPHSGLPPQVEELAPVVNVLKKLETGEDLSESQKEEVQRVRDEDKRIKREAVGLQFRAMRTKLELHRLEQRLTDQMSDKERDGLLKIAGMWRHWLDKWQRRRRRLYQNQRDNLQRLVAMFLVSQQEWEALAEEEEGQELLRGVRHANPAGRLPSYGASRPDLIKKGGLLVVKPHRPGSKWQGIQPPETSVPTGHSSKHFRFDPSS